MVLCGSLRHRDLAAQRRPYPQGVPEPEATLDGTVGRPRTTKLYTRRRDGISFEEVAQIAI